jgi:hypothetical protein
MQLQLPPNTTTLTWLLTIMSCLLQRCLPHMNLLDASCASKKTPVRGANEWALEPTAPRVHEAACPTMSLWLCDPIKGVGDRA